MTKERTRPLSQQQLSDMVAIRAVGRLGFDREPREQVAQGVLMVFRAQRAQTLLDLAAEHDIAFPEGDSLVGSLKARFPDTFIGQDERMLIRPFKSEVATALTRARLKTHTYREEIATECGELIKRLYLEGFDDRPTETTSLDIL